MKIKADGMGGWKLMGFPAGTQLRRVTITFSSDTSHAGGNTTACISPVKVRIRVKHPNGKSESFTGIGIEWQADA